jgi:hypothetical protein
MDRQSKKNIQEKVQDYKPRRLIAKRYKTSRAIRCNVTATTTKRRDEMINFICQARYHSGVTYGGLWIDIPYEKYLEMEGHPRFDVRILYAERPDTTTKRRDEMNDNRNAPAAPTPDGYANGEMIWSGETVFTKHESASLQILCSLLTVRGYASDDDLTTHACQIADLWFDKLEQD